VLSLPPAVRVFVAVAPLDMRGSFDALAGAVRRLGLDPVNGHLYLFLNKRRRIAKALWFDGSGWCVLAKRLAAGSFQLPPLDGDKPQVAIDGSAFASLLAGIDFTAARRGWYRKPRLEKSLKTIDTDLQLMGHVGASNNGCPHPCRASSPSPSRRVPEDSSVSTSTAAVARHLFATAGGTARPRSRQKTGALRSPSPGSSASRALAPAP
jgi:transposase